jgi:hypothetical protein
MGSQVAGETGVPAENTLKYQFAYHNGGWTFAYVAVVAPD